MENSDKKKIDELLEIHQIHQYFLLSKLGMGDIGILMLRLL